MLCPVIIIKYVTLILRLIQLDWLNAPHHSKQEWTSQSKHEACTHQTIQRQQRSAGKHTHISEQSYRYSLYKTSGTVNLWQFQTGCAVAEWWRAWTSKWKSVGSNTRLGGIIISPPPSSFAESEGIGFSVWFRWHMKAGAGVTHVRGR